MEVSIILSVVLSIVDWVDVSGVVSESVVPLGVVIPTSVDVSTEVNGPVVVFMGGVISRVVSAEDIVDSLSVSAEVNSSVVISTAVVGSGDVGPCVGIDKPVVASIRTFSNSDDILFISSVIKWVSPIMCSSKSTNASITLSTLVFT